MVYLAMDFSNGFVFAPIDPDKPPAYTTTDDKLDKNELVKDQNRTEDSTTRSNATIGQKFQIFASDTSLHGIKHIFNSKHNYFRR